MIDLSPTTSEPTGPSADLVGENKRLRRTNEELRAVNEELRRTSEQLRVANEELRAASGDLTALYNQLTGELEETNRGVVALYAELDDKTALLHAASEAKSRFLANVSHELRAPVTAIIGLGRLLADSASEPLTTEQRRQVEFIQGSAADLLALVNDLLDLAKAEAGRLEPQWAEVDLAAVFGQLRGTLRALHRQPGVELVVAEPAPRAVLRSDEKLLAQILRNLLSNALKFTEHGQVRLVDRWPAGRDRVELEVSDTGIGIPEELQERIFEEFYQVPGPIQGRTHGTGLGLPYARRLAQLLGGTLRVSSGPGEGSVFTLSLPTERR